MIGKCKRCSKTKNLNTKGICTDCNVLDIKKRAQDVKKSWRRELLALAGKERGE